MAVDAIRRAHSVPFGMYYLSLPYCGVVLPPGSSVSCLGTQKAGACHRCFIVSPDNFIPGFPAHVPRKGPHTVRWMIW
jgi:hypothetical protein